MRRLSLPELRLIRERWTADGVPGLERLATVPTFQELRPALDGELRRSRRYERPLAVLAVVPEPDAAGVNGAAAQRPAARRGAANGNGVHANGSHDNAGERSRANGHASTGNGSNGHGSNGNGSNGHGPHANGGGYGTGASVHDDSGSVQLHGSYTPRAGAEPLYDLSLNALQPMYWTQLRYLLLGSLLCGTLRESDVVGYAADSQEFLAMLPESTDVAARRAVQRLRAAYISRLGVGLRAGIAVYPADGLTLDDLVAHARRSLATAPLGGEVSHPDGNGNGGAHA